MTTPTKLTPDEMLAAVASCNNLAWKLAYRYRRANPACDLDELHGVATSAMRRAAMKFDPTRGVKFVTLAFTYARRDLIDYCRRESARGMHVPNTHKTYYAPPPVQIFAWHVPEGEGPGTEDGWGRVPQLAHEPQPNDLGEGFWDSVTRTLDKRDALVLLRVFRDGQLQQDVAKELGVAKTRVGQLLARALERLRTRTDLSELAGLYPKKRVKRGKRNAAA